MRIPQRHAEGLVPEDFLNIFQRASLHGEMARARVPEVVEPEVGQPCPLDGLIEPCSNLPPVISILPLNTLPSRLSGSGSSAVNAAIADLLKGTPRGSPFFVSYSVMRALNPRSFARSIRSHLRPRISLFRIPV